MRFRWHSSCLRRWWIESHSLYDPFLVSKSIAYYWDHPLSLIIYIGEWMIFLKDHINEKLASAQQYSRISTWFQGKSGVYVTSSWGGEAVNYTFLFSTFWAFLYWHLQRVIPCFVLAILSVAFLPELSVRTMTRVVSIRYSSFQASIKSAVSARLIPNTG